MPLTSLKRLRYIPMHLLIKGSSFTQRAALSRSQGIHRGIYQGIYWVKYHAVLQKNLPLS